MIQRNGKTFHALGLEELILFKIAILPKAIYKFNACHHVLSNDPRHFSLEQIILKFSWNHKIQNCSNSEKKEQGRRHYPPRHQTILPSYSNQNSCGTGTKTDGSMEQKGELRNKPTPLISLSLPKGAMGKSLQQVVLGKFDSLNEVRTHRHTTHKNKLKMA